jgi:hypothetical protein
MKFKRVVLPVAVEPPRVVTVRLLQLDTQSSSAVVDGVRYKAACGCWMFYLPDLQAKLFHAADGHIDCMHGSRPDEETLNQPGVVVGRYRTDDWRRALSTPITRRLAELWLVSARLWKAGLGPPPLGVCFVDRLMRDGRACGPTCGILTRNVHRMPRKLDCRLDHIRQAGVVPDQILSCVRQQVRGYVIDLCSVVGCIPEDAEYTVTGLETLFRNRPSDERIGSVLEETLQRS